MNIHKLYRFFLPHFRRKRLKLLYNLFDIKSSTTIVDIGGNMFFWKLAEQMGLQSPRVTIVNLTPQTGLTDSLSCVVADGRGLPFKDFSYDLVFSNSVIEHIGKWDSQLEFANETRRVGRNYFIQTPNIGFPVEPHLITPFVHYLPRKFQLRLLRNFTIWGLATRPSLEQCKALVNNISLLSRKEVTTLFPTATIIVERFFGLPKSIVAIGKQ